MKKRHPGVKLIFGGVALVVIAFLTQMSIVFSTAGMVGGGNCMGDSCDAALSHNQLIVQISAYATYIGLALTLAGFLWAYLSMSIRKK